MFTGPDWLETHEGDLHRQDEAHDEEGAVGCKEISSSQNLHKYIELMNRKLLWERLFFLVTDTKYNNFSMILDSQLSSPVLCNTGLRATNCASVSKNVFGI